MSLQAELDRLIAERDALDARIDALRAEIARGLRPPPDADLTDWFATVPAGARVILDGTWVCEAGLYLRGLRDVTIACEGDGPHVVAKTDGAKVTPPKGRGHKWPRLRAHVVLEGCERVRIVGMYVQGPHAKGGTAEAAQVSAFESQHAFEVAGGVGNVLHRVSARNVYGDFVYVTHLDGKPAKDTIVCGFDFQANGRQGIAVVSADGFWATWSRDNPGRISGVRRSLVDLEPNTDAYTVRRVVFSSLDGTRMQAVPAPGEAKPARLNMVAAAGAGDVSDVTIADIDYHGQVGVDVRSRPGIRRRNWTLRNIRSTVGQGNHAGSAMSFRDVDGLTIEECTIALQRNRGADVRADRVLEGPTGTGMVIAHLYGCRDVVFRHNAYPQGVGEYRVLTPQPPEEP